MSERTGRFFQVLARSFTLLVLAACLAITMWGLLHLDWVKALPWASPGAAIRFTGAIVAFSAILAAGHLWFRQTPIVLACAIAFGIAIATGNTWQLFVAVWFVVASTLLGRTLLSYFRIVPAPMSLVNQFLIGAGVYATAVGIIAHFAVSYAGLYGLALAMPIVARWSELKALAFTAASSLNVSSQDGDSKDGLTMVIAVVALLHFTLALLPEVSFDALALHLLVPGHLAARHEWGFDPGLYAMALIPMLGDWMFSIGFMLAGESSARLINLVFTLVMGLQCRQLVLWCGGSNAGANWSSLLFLSMPLAAAETSSLHVEAVWGAFLLAGISAVLGAVCEQEKRIAHELKLGGLFLGLAAAAKAITLCFLPLLATLLLAKSLLRPVTMLSTKGLVAASLGLSFFLAFGTIPYITAWAIAGNPFHPFFNETFKSPFYPPVNFDNSLFKSGISWDTVYEVVFNSGKYLEATVGASGFQWMLLLPAAAAGLAMQLKPRTALILGVGVLSVAVVFFFQSYLRYVYPCAVLLLVPIGMLFSKNEIERPRIVETFAQLSGMFCICLNIAFFTSATWTYRDFPIEILLDGNLRNKYLEVRQPIRGAVEALNRINSNQSPVAIFGPGFGAGLNADALYLSWYNHRFDKQIQDTKSSEEIARVLASHGSEYVILDDGWSTSERRQLVTGATSQVAKIGRVSIRQVREELRYGLELLQNPDLEKLVGWSVPEGATTPDQTGWVSVTKDRPIVQRLSIQADRRYLNTVSARCAAVPAQGRVQVNWHDAEMRFISTDISVFDCSVDWQENRQLATSPKGAAFAVVYGTSHTEAPIQITRISFR